MILPLNSSDASLARQRRKLPAPLLKSGIYKTQQRIKRHCASALAQRRQSSAELFTTYTRAISALLNGDKDGE